MVLEMRCYCSSVSFSWLKQKEFRKLCQTAVCVASGPIILPCNLTVLRTVYGSFFEMLSGARIFEWAQRLYFSPTLTSSTTLQALSLWVKPCAQLFPRVLNIHQNPHSGLLQLFEKHIDNVVLNALQDSVILLRNLSKKKKKKTASSPTQVSAHYAVTFSFSSKHSLLLLKVLSPLATKKNKQKKPMQHTVYYEISIPR